jgi:hypothetical protein
MSSATNALEGLTQLLVSSSSSVLSSPSPTLTDHNGNFPAAALTTIFTPPTGCPTAVTSLPSQLSCMPSHYDDYFYGSLGYYSPAICPTGYTIGCSREPTGNAGPSVAATETAMICCPRQVLFLFDHYHLTNVKQSIRVCIGRSWSLCEDGIFDLRNRIWTSDSMGVFRSVILANRPNESLDHSHCNLQINLNHPNRDIYFFTFTFSERRPIFFRWKRRRFRVMG